MNMSSGENFMVPSDLQLPNSNECVPRSVANGQKVFRKQCSSDSLEQLTENVNYTESKVPDKSMSETEYSDFESHVVQSMSDIISSLCPDAHRKVKLFGKKDYTSSASVDKNIGEYESLVCAVATSPIENTQYNGVTLLKGSVQLPSKENNDTYVYGSGDPFCHSEDCVTLSDDEEHDQGTNNKNIVGDYESLVCAVATSLIEHAQYNVTLLKGSVQLHSKENNDTCVYGSGDPFCHSEDCVTKSDGNKRDQRNNDKNIDCNSDVGDSDSWTDIEEVSRSSSDIEINISCTDFEGNKCWSKKEDNESWSDTENGNPMSGSSFASDDSDLSSDSEDSDLSSDSEDSDLTSDNEDIGPRSDTEESDPKSDSEESDPKSDSEECNPRADSEDSSNRSDSEDSNLKSDSENRGPMSDCEDNDFRPENEDPIFCTKGRYPNFANKNGDHMSDKDSRSDNEEGDPMPDSEDNHPKPDNEDSDREDSDTCSANKDIDCSSGNESSDSGSDTQDSIPRSDVVDSDPLCHNYNVI